MVDSPFIGSTKSISENQTFSNANLSAATPASRADLRLATLRSSSKSCKTSSRSSISDSTERSGKSYRLPATSSYGCPEDCPYFKVGLPCQRHNLQESASRHHQAGRLDFQQIRPINSRRDDHVDLIDSIDLRRIHRVPNNNHIRRTPPPPPLPPKPHSNTDRDLITPVINNKNCPYVGKVFNV